MLGPDWVGRIARSALKKACYRRAITGRPVLLVVTVLCTVLTLTCAKSDVVMVTPAGPRIPGAGIDEIAIPRNGAHLYYTTASGDLSVYQPGNRPRPLITGENVWNISVASNGSAIAYNKTAPDGKSALVWLLGLDPRTGLTTTLPRLVIASSGH